MEEACQTQGASLPPLGSPGPASSPPLGVTRAAQLNAEVTQAMVGAEQAEGVVPRALRLLCDSHGATAGHLYLVGPDGLQLAASYGSRAADASLLGMAQERLAQDVQGPGSSTSTTRGTVHSGAVWTDRGGLSYQPRLLSCVVDGVALCAGIAVLAQGRIRPRSNRLMQFTAAVGAYLIQAGASRGA
jgi:hypothetical protein